MSIVPLPLPAHVEARPLLHLLLEHGDIVGIDTAGRTIIQLAVNDHTLDTLMSFDANELEDQGDNEPDADDECDGPPIMVELAPPKLIRRRRASISASGSVN
jgi:hypothetical protein